MQIRQNKFDCAIPKMDIMAELMLVTVMKTAISNFIDIDFCDMILIFLLAVFEL